MRGALSKTGPQNDLVNVQSREGQFGGFEITVETGQESNWMLGLSPLFFSLFFGAAIA